MLFSLSEIKEIFSLLGAFGFGGIIFGFFIFFLLKSFIPTYLSKKAENLATREDIAKITDEIERIKSQYSVLIEELKAKHQLRMAALDRRLQVHQEAYQLWRKINTFLGTEKIEDVVFECNIWWGKNCLYLEPEAREAFLKAFVGAKDLEWYKTCQNASDLVSKVYKEINDAGRVIEQCVALPTLNEFEVLKQNT